MEWWQYILLYLGIWILGFFTGMKAGTVFALNRLAQPKPTSIPLSGIPDIAALQALMNSQAGRGQ